ncbi:MAG: TlpA disulfide reductase family protein [Chloroflexota bacterium]
MTTQDEYQVEEGRNPIVLVIGGIVLLLATAFLIFNGTLSGDGSAAEAPASDVVLPQTGPPLTVGDLAYEFELQDLDGNTVALSDHLGKPIIINYWASWCAPCRIEMPELQATHEAYRDQDLVILALNQDETADTARIFFEGMGLTFTNPLLDVDVAVADNYGVRNLPTTMFINEEGVITAIHRGPATRGQFDGYLAETLSAN